MVSFRSIQILNIMSQKSAKSPQSVLYIVVKHGNRIYFQKKGEFYQLIAIKVDPRDDLSAKAKKLLEEKIDEVLPVSAFRQISSKNYHDTERNSQKCYVFCASVLSPLDEEKLGNIYSFDIQNIKEDTLHDVNFRDITKKILLDNYASILR